jgi:hypothetical protein
MDAAQYTGASLGMIGFTLRSLKADLIDVVSNETYKRFGFGIRVGSTPNTATRM